MVVNSCEVDDIRSNIHFGDEVTSSEEIGGKVRTLKNGKSLICIERISGEMKERM